MRLAIVAAVLASIACSALAADPTHETFANAARKYVARGFKDPSSAQYRDQFIAKTSGGVVLCGEVNAKNSYGGYVGFRRFYATENFAQVDDRAGYFDSSYRVWCSDKLAELD